MKQGAKLSTRWKLTFCLLLVAFFLGNLWNMHRILVRELSKYSPYLPWEVLDRQM